MGYKGTALPAQEATSTRYTYEITGTLQPVQAAFAEILAAGVDQVALVIIRLFYAQEACREQTTQSSAYLLSILRPMVRKTDCVFLQENTLYFVLRAANQQGGSIVETRLWEALLWRVHNMAEIEFLRPVSMTIGHSGYQESNASIEESIEAANVASLRYNRQGEKVSRKEPRHLPALPQTTEDDSELPELARKLGIPYLSLFPQKLPIGVQRLVNPSLAQELRCFPIGRERNTLTVAMQNPQDNEALNRLHEETGLLIFPVLAHPETLQHALEQLV
jgi:Type II secretion system (T2SS), protein E, N-terminal domain